MIKGQNSVTSVGGIKVLCIFSYDAKYICTKFHENPLTVLNLYSGHDFNTKKLQRGIIPLKKYADIRFLFSASCALICTQFNENIFYGSKVLEDIISIP